MNNSTSKAKYLRPEAEIISLQTIEVQTSNGLSAFNVESKMNDWLVG